MKEEQEKVAYYYPEELFDEDGYPTGEALEYINNWSILFDEGEARVGQYVVDHDKELIDYIISIWTYYNESQLTENSLELHTLGWSGNESIVSYLKKTWFWSSKWFMTIRGGHYYFTLSDKGEEEIINNLKA